MNYIYMKYNTLIFKQSKMLRVKMAALKCFIQALKNMLINILCHLSNLYN